jgi:tRNA wybutosine-synthesizing protein 3
MVFEKDKERYMNKFGKSDRSRIGLPDPQIVTLLDAINVREEYYTTSSCAGRISIMQLSPDKKKYNTKWLFISHNDISSSDDMIPILHLKKEEEGYELWFKMESPILHVCACDIKSAQKLLSLAQQAGLKHTGIISTSRRVMLEIYDTTRVDALLAHNGKMLVDDEYIKIITDIANEKLALTRKRMTKLEMLIAKL